MLGKLLLHEASRAGNRTALVRGSQLITYSDLAAEANRLSTVWSFARGQCVGLAVSAPVHFVPAAAALDMLGAHTFLCGEWAEGELISLQKTFGWDVVLREADLVGYSGGTSSRCVDGASVSAVTILTSGTTGRPKAANHTWETLAAPVRRAERYLETRWFTAYPLAFYAGLQVLLQVLLNSATLVVPNSREPQEVVRALSQADVTHASGTPTFWRRLLLFAPRQELGACPLQQITLGGEVVTQDVLDRLRATFPHARIVHIYASTEMGRIFTVTDGREGFPARYLETSPEEGIEIRIIEDQLQVRSRNKMLGYEGRPSPWAAGNWFPTGDRVEIQGDRVRFLGRITETINVGGAKVFPAQVEEVIRQVPEVAVVRVYPKRSSLVGALVAAEIQPMPGADPRQVRAAVERACAERLAPYQRPRIIQMVSQVATNSALKVERRCPE